MWAFALRRLEWHLVFPLTYLSGSVESLPITRTEPEAMKLKMFLNVALPTVTVLLGGARGAAAEHEMALGVQTWSLRNLNFDQMVEFAAQHKIKYLELIPNHIDPKGSWDDIKKKKET